MSTKQSAQPEGQPCTVTNIVHPVAAAGSRMRAALRCMMSLRLVGSSFARIERDLMFGPELRMGAGLKWSNLLRSFTKSIKSERMEIANYGGKRYKESLCTGWPIRLFPRFCCHLNKGCISVCAFYTKTQLLFCYQRHIGNNLMGHLVVWCQDSSLICSWFWCKILGMSIKDHKLSWQIA